MLAYLAGPIDGEGVDGTSWYEEAEALAPPGWVLFKPALAFASAGADPSVVHAANSRVIRHVATVVIANLTGPGRALGTIREIEYAKHHSTPVLVVADASLEESLMAYDLIVVPSLAEAWMTIGDKMEEAEKAAQQHPLMQFFGIRQEEDDD